MLHMKTGSDTPMKVTFNKLLDVGILLVFLAVAILQTCSYQRDKWIRKTPTYNEVAGANVTPATFYSIGNFEVQDNLARVWVDIGTVEPLIFDVLINALVTISSDHVGIKQVVFGGSQFENWKENFNVEEAGWSVHKI